MSPQCKSLRQGFKERWPNAISKSLHANVTTTNGRHFSYVKKSQEIRNLKIL